MNKLSKEKKVNHIKIDEKRVKVVDFYPDLFFNKQIPISEAFIDRFCQEMIEFAELETTIRPSQFWLGKRMNSTYITRWREKWPQMQSAYEYLLACCAMRRDVGAATRKLDGSYIGQTQVMYDSEWKNIVEWRASLGDKDGDSKGNIVLQMITAPISDQVAPRVKIE